MTNPSARPAPRINRRDLLRGALGFAATSLLLPLRAHGEMRTRFVAYPFTLGVASAYPRGDGFSIWTRLAPAPLQADGGMTRDEWVTVTWQVAEDEKFARIVREGRVRTVPELAHSAHVDVDGLRPDRHYFYRFLAQDETSPIGRSWTAPMTGGARDRLKFALASCQHFEQGYYSAYRHLLADDAELVVFVGDYIYESSWGDDLVRRYAGGETYTLDDYRIRHAQTKTDPDLQRAHAALPWLLIWDDHEVDNDPAGLQAESLDPRFAVRRAAAYQAYYEHMPLPRAMLPQADGRMKIYTHVDIGRLARFYLLDDRQYRSPQACPNPYKGGGSTDVDPRRCPGLADPARTMLGDVQQNWLERSLAGSQARWNILTQQTLMSPLRTVTGDGYTVWTDGWDGYPTAREKIFAALERGVANPLVIGGDIHATVITDLKRDPWNPKSPVLAAEVCGTSLTSQGWPQTRYNQYLKDNPHLQFGRSDRRGYCLFQLDRHARVDIRAVDDVKKRASRIETIGRFIVEDGRPGLRRA